MQTKTTLFIITVLLITQFDAVYLYLTNTYNFCDQILTHTLLVCATKKQLQYLTGVGKLAGENEDVGVLPVNVCIILLLDSGVVCSLLIDF